MPKWKWASKNNFPQDAGSEKKQLASLQNVGEFAIEDFRRAFGQKQRVKEDRITPLSKMVSLVHSADRGVIRRLSVAHISPG